MPTLKVSAPKAEASQEKKKTQAAETASDRRAYLRQKAGWPPLKG